MLRVLVVGSGGREHALAWKLAQSEQVERVYVAPGNAGTALEPKVENVNVKAEEIERLADFARQNRIDLTVVGPEAPLVAGIVDVFRRRGLRCLGPTQKAARLEGSKAFCKAFLARYRIPTAAYAVFSEPEAAIAYIRAKGAPIVVKADGLAAGKGVVVAHTEAEAVAAVRSMLAEGAFGEAGRQVVIEEFLEGEELSFIVLADGEDFVPLATSQDHKRLLDGDLGPNTGGMGAYSPAPLVTREIERQILEQIVRPTLAGMAAEGSPYTGFLYAGLMLTRAGPKVLEFNCRLGDPETQVILLRLQSDLAELCLAATASLAGVSATWDRRAALGVVLAAPGYPAAYRTGDVIEGLPAEEEEDVKVFHAGTRLEAGRVVTAGGRVLCVCALGDGVLEAQRKAYAQVEKIHWPGAHYRRDIGWRAVRRA
nr:phosphoribosylamine--glycine ligase [uncultured Gammaproteobacteria bacterium]